MKLNYIFDLIDTLTAGDNGFEYKDIINHCQLALNSIHSNILLNSAEYYNKSTILNLQIANKQKIKIPDDYYLINYVCFEDYNELIEIPKATYRNTFENDDLIYIFENPYLVFFNNTVFRNVELNYFYTPENIPLQESEKNNFIIDIPRFTYNFFTWIVLRNLKIQDGEIEKLLNISWDAANNEFKGILNKKNNTYQKDYRKFKSYY